MNLIVKAEAEAEIDRIVAWYARNMPERRRTLLLALDAAMGQILETPLVWPAVTGAKLPEDVVLRRYVMQDFRFVLPYLVRQESIHVIAIAHTSRNSRYWMARARRLSRQT